MIAEDTAATFGAMPSRTRIQLLIVAIAGILFVPGLGAVNLFDWDEINFAEIAREMIVTGDWSRPQIDYLPFHEKPPLFMWMQGVCMLAFGVGEFAARLPNAICGMFTLVVLFRIGDQLRGRVFGMLWALAYIGSILPHLYFRSGIIDPWFNLFIFLGLHALITLVQSDPHRHPEAMNSRRDVHAWLAGLFLGLAVLTKGPVGVLVPGLVMAVYWALRKFKPFLLLRRLGIIALATALTAGSWAFIDLLKNGPEFIVAFFWRQVAMLTTEDAGHGGFFGYHFIVLLLGCFPASVFTVQELLRPTRVKDEDANDHRRWMVILFWVVLILFSIVRTKIVHYSSLCYFPLTYLAALQLERIWKEREGFGWSRFLVGVLGSLIALVFLVVPFLGQHPEWVRPLLAKDAFALANLDAPVHWTAWDAIAGAFLLVALLVAHVLHGRGSFRQSLLVLFGATALFVTSGLYFFINNIEGYSQRAAIDYFKSLQGERCHVITKNYKSYAQLFYTRKPPPVSARAHDETWLLYGDVDRPVHVVCKVTSLEEVSAIPTLERAGGTNGFHFFVRKPELSGR